MQMLNINRLLLKSISLLNGFTWTVFYSCSWLYGHWKTKMSMSLGTFYQSKNTNLSLQKENILRLPSSMPPTSEKNSSRFMILLIGDPTSGYKLALTFYCEWTINSKLPWLIILISFCRVFPVVQRTLAGLNGLLTERYSFGIQHSFPICISTAARVNYWNTTLQMGYRWASNTSSHLQQDSSLPLPIINTRQVWKKLILYFE